MNESSIDMISALERPERRVDRNLSINQLTNSPINHLTHLFSSSKITERDRIDFCTQLSVMLLSRVPLHRALEVQEVQSKSPVMKSIVRDIRTCIAGGSSLSSAVSAHPASFDELFVVTAEVGEESGRLGQTLGSLAEHMEKMAGLKKKLSQALTYPTLVMAVAAGAVGFLLAFIIPTFADMFKSFQMELPWSTRAVMSLSTWLTVYGPFAVIAFSILAFLSREWFRSPRTRKRLEKLAIRIPYLGPIILQNYLARFCRTLGTLLQSQVSLVDALATTRRILTHDALRREVAKIEDAVRRGRNVAAPVLASTLFPPMVAQMITVGEETSELDKMLLKVGSHYEKVIDKKIETLATVVEPVIIVFVGVIVAIILISMYLPMFDLTSHIT